MVIDGFIALHVLSGVVAVLAGAAAMLATKGSRRHRRRGGLYLAALVGLCGSAPILALIDWAHRWHLVVLAAVAAGFATLGLLAARLHWHRWLASHIVGMGGAYITMLTAFYVDNGPRLPLWNQLPPVSFWFLPAAIGLPVLLRALRRQLRSPPPLRSSAADRAS